jgi:hypothetical protein
LGGAFATIIGIMLLLMGIFSLYEHRNAGFLMILGAFVIWALIIYARANRNPFSIDQLNLLRDLNEKEIERIKAMKQQIINEGAKRGESIPTDKILERLDELKSSYQGPNPEHYFAEIDKIKMDFQKKYGASIPVDEAYKILTDYEQKYGGL